MPETKNIKKVILNVSDYYSITFELNIHILSTGDYEQDLCSVVEFPQAKNDLFSALLLI